MAKVCPFARFFPQMGVVAEGSGSGSGSGSTSGVTHSSHPASPTISGLVTPSFAPNAEPDHVPETRVTISEIVASINKSAPAQGLNVDDVVLPDELVWSEPISTLLKVGTARAHQDAETSAGAEALVKGQLELEEYIRWNAILWRVYNALELGLAEHNDHSVLSPTYDPATLARSELLAKDIRYLLTLLPSTSAHDISHSTLPTDPSSPLPPFPLPAFLSPIFNLPPPGLQTYLSHLRSLSTSRPEGLLAHSYVRYLGDMSGGQFIAARVKRAYALPKVLGTEFYHFNQDGVAPDAEESMADTKRRLGDIKDWFRRGMDEGVAEDQETKRYLVKEANLAFALNTHLFALINPPPASTPAANTTATTPHAPAPADPSQPNKRYYELRQQKKPVEETPQTWNQYIGRFAFAAFAVILGQVIARFGVPYVQRVYGVAMAK